MTGFTGMNIVAPDDPLGGTAGSQEFCMYRTPARASSVGVRGSRLTKSTPTRRTPAYPIFIPPLPFCVHNHNTKHRHHTSKKPETANIIPSSSMSFR